MNTIERSIPIPDEVTFWICPDGHRYEYHWQRYDDGSKSPWCANARCDHATYPVRFVPHDAGGS